MAEDELLTVAEVAAIFRVTLQTIRNWIAWGKLPSVRVGRGFRVRRADVDALMDHAQAGEGGLATARDVWDPSVQRLVQRSPNPVSASLWESDAGSTPLLPRKQP